MNIDEEVEVFSKNIIMLRKKSGLGVEQMARIMKISVAQLRDLERGVFPDEMPVDVIFRIQKYFGIKASKLFAIFEC